MNKLTAEELVAIRKNKWGVDRDELNRILDTAIAAAEKNERLRAAIEKHRASHQVCSEPRGQLHAGFDEELWKTLKKYEQLQKYCNHEYEEVGGRNTNYRLYFNGTNAYIVCRKCGHKERT